MVRTLAVQSVLYRTPERDVIRSARAVATAAARAQQAGLLGDWQYLLGDCSDELGLGDEAVEAVRVIAAGAGGAAQYVHFDGNLGHGGGHNRLSGASSSDLLLFLNPDSVLAPDALVWQLRASTPGVGAVDARQMPFEHPKDYDVQSGETSWASGACLMTPRDVFVEVGRFDHDSFFMYCDDVDYSWRVRLSGRSVLHEPSARLFHDKRFDLKGDIMASPAERYYSAEAAVILAIKYSRPDLADEIMSAFERSDDHNLLRAHAEIRRRRKEGNLPHPLDTAGEVAQFVSGNYAKHRF